MAKRKERVAPPPEPDGWDFRFASNDAVKGWDQVCAAASANARRAWDRITTDPRHRDDRQHPLKGSLGTRTVDGKYLEQWQFEVTSAGRIWYCIDDARRVVWMTDCSIGHPKSTEQRLAMTCDMVPCRHPSETAEQNLSAIENLIIDTGVFSATLAKYARQDRARLASRINGNQNMLSVQTVAELRSEHFWPTGLLSWGPTARTLLSHYLID